METSENNLISSVNAVQDADSYLPYVTSLVSSITSEHQNLPDDEELSRRQKIIDSISPGKTPLKWHSYIGKSSKHPVVTLICASCGHTWSAKLTCSDRTCPRCSRIRRERILDRFVPLISNMEEPKLLTLTVKSVPLTRASVIWLLKCFKKLMRSKLMSPVRSWVRNVEFTTLSDLGLCNLHIHSVIDSPFIPQEAISERWSEITNGSMVVDIRAVKRQLSDSRGLVKYISKALVGYLSKSDDETLPEWQKAIINEAFRNIRLIQSSNNLPMEKVSNCRCPTCGCSLIKVLEYDLYISDFSEEVVLQ